MTKFRPVLAMIGILWLTIALSFSGVGHAQPGLTQSEAAKLDPVLKLLLDHPPADAKPQSLASLVPPVPDELSEGGSPRVLAKGESLPAEALEQLSETIGFHPGGRESTVDVLIKTTGDLTELRALGIKVQSQVGDIVTANVPLGRLRDLAGLESVVAVEASRILAANNDVSVPDTGAVRARQDFGVSGEDVVVAFIDSGIDFTHEDFRNPDGSTRIKYLLDLSDPGDLDSNGTLDGPDDFGATLYTEDDINAALADNGAAYRSTDTPREIPDNRSSGVTSRIVVPDDLTVESLAVKVYIVHFYRGDLKVCLTSPAGTRRCLSDRSGGSRNHIIGTFDLDDFVGESAHGTWSLKVSDHAARDTGTLYSWSLKINQVVRHEDVVGHGTHGAGTAAGSGRGTGNGMPAGTYAGMAPEADLIVVQGSRTDGGGLLTQDVVNALAFIDEMADRLGKPYVVNMSFGGHFGPHDGTALHEQAIDSLVGPGIPGKAIVISAGNEGDEDIHASGTVPPGRREEVEFEIPRGGGAAVIDVWYEGSDSFGVGFVDPRGHRENRTIDPGDDGDCYFEASTVRLWLVCVESELNNPDNGDREIVLQFVVIRPTGDWRFMLHGDRVEDGRFDAWILGSEFTSDIDPGMRVAMPGTARNAVTVGAYVTKDEWTDASGSARTCRRMLSASRCRDVGNLASFSSDGPTRDGRQKPEIVAPGQMIASTYSADAPAGSLFSMFPTNEWIVEDGTHGISMGTSFAAPHVTGAVALLLEMNRGLDANGIRDLLTSAARPDEFTGGLPNEEWGHGKLDVYAALQTIATIASPTPTATETPTPTPTATQTSTLTPTRTATSTQTPAPTPTEDAQTQRQRLVYVPLILRNHAGVTPPPTATREPATRTPTAAVTPTPTDTPTSSAGLTIFGAVQACTGERVPGATVTLEGTGQSTETDARGNYTLGPLADFLAGNYQLTASKTGYESRSVTLNLPSEGEYEYNFAGTTCLEPATSTPTATQTPMLPPTAMATAADTSTPTPTTAHTSTPTLTPTAAPTSTRTPLPPGGLRAIVTNSTDLTIHIIDATIDTAAGPFLRPLGRGDSLLDAVVTPDGRTALVSDFDGSSVNFIDLTTPTPTLLGSVVIHFSAEDIALSPDGRWALVTDGGTQNRVAVIDVLNRQLVQTLIGPVVQAVAVAADGETVLAVETNGDRVHILHLTPETGELTWTGEHRRTGTRPINVTISPDGRTALVANFWEHTVTVLRIDAPGDVVRIGELIHLVGYPQSVVFSPDGTRAYVASVHPRHRDQLSVLNINGPGDVVDSGIRIQLDTRETCGFYGVDTLAVSPDGEKAYVGNPCVFEAQNPSDKVTVVDLINYRVAGKIPVGRYPVGIAFFSGQ